MIIIFKKNHSFTIYCQLPIVPRSYSLNYIKFIEHVNERKVKKEELEALTFYSFSGLLKSLDLEETPRAIKLLKTRGYLKR